MNWFWLASALMVLLAIAHSVLGERNILIRLFRQPLPRLFGDDRFTKATLRFVWHALTIAWFGLAAALVWVPEPAVAWIVIGALAATSVLTIAINVRHLSWVVEWLTIGCILLGL